MRLTVVEPAGRGGMIHYAFQLCRALAQQGLETTLVTDRRYELENVEAPFRVVKLFDLWDPKPEEAPPTRTARVARRLRRPLRAFRYGRECRRLCSFLRRQRPDWIQLGDIRFAGDLFWITALRRSGLRLTDVCHNIRRFAPGGTAAGQFHFRQFERPVYRRIYHHFDRVWVHFESNRRRLVSELGVEPERVGTIPHGNETLLEEMQDPTVTPVELRRRLCLGKDDLVVLFFGALARYKGAEVLLAAFPRILESEPRARLVLAGYPSPGFSLESFRRQAHAAGIEQAVRIHPHYVPSPEVAAWMELATLTVFPYREVFQSGAIHLAQTFGRPIVATSVGAIPEAIRHRETALLVPPGDAEALVLAVTKLLARPHLAHALADRGRQEALDCFNWQRVAATLAADYRRLH